jgi:predicted MFS family arabinose efflux permease
MSPSPLFRDRHPVAFVTLVILVMCMAQTFFMGTPVFVGLMGEQWGWTQSQIGLTVTAEILGNAAGSLGVAFLLGRRPVRAIVLAALLLLLATNAWMATGPGPAACTVARALSGVGTGAISGLVFRFLSIGEKADRQLSLAILAQNLFSILLVAVVLPRIGSASAGFWLVAGLCAACLPAWLLFGHRETIVDAQADGRLPVQRLGAYLSLLALLLLYAGVGVVWTFLDQLGQTTGLSADTLSWILGGSTAFSLVGCVVAPRAMAAGQRYAAAVSMMAACAIAALALSHTPLTGLLYAAAAAVFMVGWNAAAILLFSTVPLYDPVGRHVAMAPGFLGLGYAIGTMLGAHLLDSTTADHAFTTAAWWCLLATVCYAVLKLVPPGHVLAAPAPAPEALPKVFP